MADRTRKWRCTYSFPCGPYDRHCFNAVPVDEPDVPGRCNFDPGDDPDWKPSKEDRYVTPETAKAFGKFLRRQYGAVVRARRR